MPITEGSNDGANCPNSLNINLPSHTFCRKRATEKLIPPWVSRRRGIQSILDRLAEIACFSNRADEGVMHKFLKIAVGDCEQNPTDYWFYNIWEGHQSETMLKMYGIAQLTLPLNICVIREGLGQLLGNYKPAETKTLSTENSGISRYLHSYFGAANRSHITLFSPICSIGHWGMVVIRADMDTHNGRRVPKRGTIYFGDSLNYSPFRAGSSDLNCLHLMQNSLSSCYPGSSWAICNANYTLHPTFIGFKRQRDSFSCGFYLVAAIATFATCRGILPHEDYRQYSSPKTTEKYRWACCISAFEGVQKAMSEQSTTVRGIKKLTRNRLERRQWDCIGTRWPTVPCFIQPRSLCEVHIPRSTELTPCQIQRSPTHPVVPSENEEDDSDGSIMNLVSPVKTTATHDLPEAPSSVYPASYRLPATPPEGQGNGADIAKADTNMGTEPVELHQGEQTPSLRQVRERYIPPPKFIPDSRKKPQTPPSTLPVQPAPSQAPVLVLSPTRLDTQRMPNDNILHDPDYIPSENSDDKKNIVCAESLKDDTEGRCAQTTTAQHSHATECERPGVLSPRDIPDALEYISRQVDFGYVFGVQDTRPYGKKSEDFESRFAFDACSTRRDVLLVIKLGCIAICKCGSCPV